MKNTLIAILIGVLALTLFYTVTLLPPMGEPGNPTARHIIPRYLEYGVEEAGAENIVTGVILNYRGYDTLGEVTVIFAALVAVLGVLSGRKKDPAVRFDALGIAPSLIVRTTVILLVPFIMLFSIYTILHGDVSPGGGFQGGAIIGASLIVFTTILGLPESIRKVPDRFRIPLEGAAPMVFILVGILGVFVGSNFLTYILPGISPGLQATFRTMMLLMLEMGIGVGGAMIFTSILFALLREE